MAKTDAISGERKNDSAMKLWEMFQQNNQVQKEKGQSKQIPCVWTYASGAAYHS